jgi:hypothetical protein
MLEVHASRRFVLRARKIGFHTSWTAADTSQRGMSGKGNGEVITGGKLKSAGAPQEWSAAGSQTPALEISYRIGGDAYMAGQPNFVSVFFLRSQKFSRRPIGSRKRPRYPGPESPEQVAPSLRKVSASERN